MSESQVVVANYDGQDEGDLYREFLLDFQKNFYQYLVSDSKLFTTNATGLFDAFLSKIPEERRQHYTCHACRDFVNSYGGLVSIDDDGNTIPVMWLPTNFPLLNPSIRACQKIVASAKVNGVFVTSLQTLGKPQTGPWSHMSITLPSDFVFKSRTQTAGQKAAEKREDFKTLINSILDYPIETVAKALELLRTGSLARSDRFLNAVKWFMNVHEMRDNTTGKDRKTNVVWKAVASAPPGLCHVRSSVIGTLLDDIKEGRSFETIRRKFGEKVDAIKYQRPKADPNDGNIEQAEKLIATLGIERSLRRRLATFNDLQFIWLPRLEVFKKTEGVFGHLKKSQREDKIITTSPKNITMEKFMREVAPNTKKIEVLISRFNDNYTTFLTSIHEDDPPILRWDIPDCRNPVSWYVYHGGSPASSWGLNPGSWTEVIGICEKPSMWNKDLVLYTEEPGVIFCLGGARDSYYQKCGLGLFPEILKSDLHSIRSTLEAFSRKGVIEGDNLNSIGGILYVRGTTNTITCKISSNGVDTVYKIDRWD